MALLFLGLVVDKLQSYAELFDIKSPVMEETITNASPKPRKVKGRVEIEIQRCKACELCIEECKENALSLGDTINLKGYRYIIANNGLCTGCVNCALVCPDAVITVYRTNVKKQKLNVAPDEIREQLKKNIIQQ